MDINYNKEFVEVDGKNWEGPDEFDIFKTYLEYVSDTEPPVNYFRWSLLTSLGAILGRSVFIRHGSFRVFPTLYTIFVGEPASRKSTSIKLTKKLIRAAGYETFAADKTSKEKFLLDLEGYIEPEPGGAGKWAIEKKDPAKDNITQINLWGSVEEDSEPKEVFVVADELAEFTGTGNSEFYTTLGNIWDWDDEEAPFTQRLKNSKSVSIYQPTISLLGGTTAELFSRIFPPECIGSGFLSRVLLIYGERSSRCIPFPAPPDEEVKKLLISYFSKLRATSHGEVPVSGRAKEILGEIYSSWKFIDDARFAGYSNRRFTQLLKLCLIISIARGRSFVCEASVIEANTVLTHAEFLMPKALGEFGKSRNSDVASKIMGRLEATKVPLTIKEIWTYVQRDLEKQQHLIDMLNGMQHAEKIQVVRFGTKTGYLPKKEVMKAPKHIDWKFLTKEELDLAGVIVR